MKVESLTIAQWKDFAIVGIALMGLIVLLGNVVKTIKEWKNPSMSEARWREEVDRKLGADNKRIESLEEGNKVLCRGMLALLSHEINGNSIDKLQKAQEEITNYLVER